MDASYAARVGDRLRAIRLQKRLSLHEVEKASEKQFKASVLGAYERGERAISVPRLQALASFYGVPADRLLPMDNQVIDLADGARSDDSLRIDLARLETLDAPEATVIGRFVAMIQAARGDYNGRVLTVREADTRALAAALATTPMGLEQRLGELGLRAAAAR